MSSSSADVSSELAEIFLEDVGKCFSVDDLVDQLKAPTARIQEAIQELLALGYPIRSTKRQAFGILDQPQLLSVKDIEGGLKSKTIGKKILHFIHVCSTQDILLGLANEEAVEGTVVLAESQGGGRGRLDRTWISPLGGVWLSALLMPPEHLKQHQLLSLVMALAASRGIERECGLEAMIKWPNDIMVGEDKVGGVLGEAVFHGQEVRRVVVGVGVNVNIDLSLLPPSVRESASSLSEALGKSVDRGSLVRCVLEEADVAYEKMVEGHTNSIISQIKSLSTVLGNEVRITSFQGVIEGTAVDLAPDGGLVIRLADGRTRVFYSGDVVRLRPTSV